MLTTPIQMVDFKSFPRTTLHQSAISRIGAIFSKTAALWMIAIACFGLLTGCGSGGYAGGGIVSLSSSAVVIDAGQAFSVTATVSSTPIITWSLAGSSCTGNVCGTLSSTTGVAVTYTAPAGVLSPLAVTLTGAVTGTPNLKTVSITVNPDPTITGTPPPGNVGAAYSTTLVATPGTSPLVWSFASGTLPPGLTFSTTTGVISGTPTTLGTFNFAVKVVDSSSVPFTVTAPETIVISAPVPPLVVSGNPPAGIVGSLYTTPLLATGGVLPYTWSIIGGALPPGLAISASTGVISGTPTTVGTSVFTAQVQDLSGTKASAQFTFPIHAALTLTLTSLPAGMVGVSYSSTIGVAGGTPPYNCAIIAGTLQAGLTLTGCLVHGTPTVPGTANLTVTATDSSTPTATATGPVSLVIAPNTASITITSPPGAAIALSESPKLL